MKSETYNLEIKPLAITDIMELQSFFKRLDENQDLNFFNPHNTDDATFATILKSKDSYYILSENSVIVGYGLLRGWNEGYSIPSLGIAIDKMARGKGFSKLIMQFLHCLAKNRGATQVRLQVHQSNLVAINLYRNFSYDLSPSPDRENYLLGIKSLAND